MINPNLDETLEALAHLICSDRVERGSLSRAQWRHHHLSPQHFDGFELMAGDSEDIVLLGDNASDLPFWPVDVCLAHQITNERLEWQPGSWQFARTRTLDPKRWRGKLKLVGPRMIEHAIMVTEPNGQSMSVLEPLLLQGARVIDPLGTVSQTGPSGSPLFHYGPNPGWYGDRGATGHDEKFAAEILRWTGGMSLRRYYLWSVLLGEGTGPRARFSTEATGIREAFRLRDIPPGKRRRAALLHWVKAHWRKSRASASDKAWVDAYLRGAWSYAWNGLRCQIEPSIEDLDLLTERQRRTT
jgi:hypothetical protein